MRLLSPCPTKESTAGIYLPTGCSFSISLPAKLILYTFIADKKDNLLKHPEISIKNFKYIHTFM
jgi:hypothetical protein